MDLPHVVADFAAAWNSEDDAERLRLLTQSCVPDAVFVARHGVTRGVGALSASIGEFRGSFPAATVTVGCPAGFADVARFAWATQWNDGRTPLTGEDFAELAPDGRIRRIVSFDGLAAPPPRRAAPAESAVAAKAD
jgi:hypothetical protein